MVFAMQEWLDAFAGADDLKFREMRVLLALQRYATWSTGGSIRPGHAALAALSGVSVGNLKGRDGVIQSLVDKGWLAKVREASPAGRPAEYRLAFGSHRERPCGASARDSQDAAEGVSGWSEVSPEGVEADPATWSPVWGPGTQFGDVPNSSAGGPQFGDRGGPQFGDRGGPQFGDTTYSIPTHYLPTTYTAGEAPAEGDVVEGIVEPEDSTNLATLAAAKADAQIDAATDLGRRLADNLKARGIPPNYTRQWTKEMCRVLDSGATPDQVRFIIDYLPKDDFWSGLVVDAKYFADKYPKLVAAAGSNVRKQVKAERPAWMQEWERRQAATSQQTM